MSKMKVVKQRRDGIVQRYSNSKKSPLAIFNEVIARNKRQGISFDDVMVYTNKQMIYEYNDDESKGWTGTMSSIVDKKPGSNVVLLVTYDGDGYDFLSINEGASVTNEYLKELNKVWGDRYNIEHANNWAFEVYDERGGGK